MTTMGVVLSNYGRYTRDIEVLRGVRDAVENGDWRRDCNPLARVVVRAAERVTDCMGLMDAVECALDALRDALRGRGLVDSEARASSYPGMAVERWECVFGRSRLDVVGLVDDAIAWRQELLDG